jgi:hypothetical protein
MPTVGYIKETLRMIKKKGKVLLFGLIKGDMKALGLKENSTELGGFITLIILNVKEIGLMVKELDGLGRLLRKMEVIMLIVKINEILLNLCLCVFFFYLRYFFFFFFFFFF